VLYSAAAADMRLRLAAFLVIELANIYCYTAA